MNELLDLTIHNVAVIKDATLPLNRKGITVIHGLNRDAATGANSPDANAAGKSLLLKGIPELIFASNPLTQDIKSKARKDLFTHKDTSIRLRVRKGKNTFAFTKKAKGKSLAFEIEKNGKDVGVRTIKYPEEKIRSFFGMSEEEFYTLYYIDSGRQSSLQYGLPSKRLEFFTNLFRLNNYDEVRKLFNGLMREAKENSVAVREILSQLDAINRDLPKESIKELEQNLEEYSSRSVRLTEQYGDLQGRERNLAFILENQENYGRLMKMVSDLELEVETEADLRHTIKWATAKLARYRAMEKALSQHKAYEAEVERYDAKRTRIADELRADGWSLKPQATIAYADSLRNYRRKAQEIQAHIDELEEQAGELPKKPKIDDYLYTQGQVILKRLNLNPEDAIERLASDKSKIVTKREELDEQIQVLKKLKDCAECPTCRQGLSKKATKSLIEELAATYDTLGQHIDKATHELKAAKYYSNNEPAVTAYSKSVDKDLKLSNKIAEAHADLRDHEGRAEKYKKIEAFLNKFNLLTTMERPEKPDVEVGDYDSVKVEKLTKFVSVAEIMQSGFDLFHEADFAATKKELKEVKRTRESYVSEVNKYSSKIPMLTAKLELSKKLTKQRADLLKKHDNLKESIEDIPIIEMLIEAYSNKGIKLLLIKQIATLIERNMNQYAPLLYSEPTKFQFEVIDERNFNILIERKQQGKTSLSDVRTLSGAERRAFTFLLPLAIMPLIPHERRLNVMVLDEPTVNMSTARINLFTRSFIPKLNTIVPHIIIITPQQEHYDNAVKYLVTKHKGVSTLSKL